MKITRRTICFYIREDRELKAAGKYNEDQRRAEYQRQIEAYFAAKRAGEIFEITELKEEELLAA
jgi:hypothetical protein